MLVADRAPQHTTPQAAPSVGRGSSVSADVADESYVVNPFRTGMRARPRNLSYKETDLSGTSLAATGGGGGGDGGDASGRRRNAGSRTVGGRRYRAFEREDDDPEVELEGAGVVAGYGSAGSDENPENPGSRRRRTAA